MHRHLQVAELKFEPEPAVVVESGGEISASLYVCEIVCICV